MEIVLLVVVAVIIGALIYVSHNKDTIDTNKNGKIEAEEIEAAAKVVKRQAKAAVKKTVGKAKAAVAKKAKK